MNDFARTAGQVEKGPAVNMIPGPPVAATRPEHQTKKQANRTPGCNVDGYLMSTEEKRKRKG